MKKRGMRLVAMIEKIKSKDENKEEKYGVINFLPDIKVKHIGGKEFKIEENEGYIKIPYAEGIDDLTVIVGENGVGKTRLVNDILSMPADKVFVFYDVDNDRYSIHNLDVRNMLLREEKYSKKYREELRQLLQTDGGIESQLSLTDDEIDRMIYGDVIFEEDIKNVSLGKFRKDIYQEIKRFRDY